MQKGMRGNFNEADFRIQSEGGKSTEEKSNSGATSYRALNSNSKHI